jgi:predicted CopG family antitoxin
MRTINISISELEYNKFGLKEDKLSFSELIDIISRELSRQNLRKSIQLAEKYGLSKMTLEDINKEIKAVRKNAKNNN